MKLSTKTSLITCFLVIAIYFFLSLIALYFQREALRTAAFNGVDNMARTSATSIAAMIANARKNAESIAETLPSPARREAITAHLRRMYEIFGIDNGIFVLDANGIFLADYPVHPELRGQSFAFRDYYIRTVAEGRGVVGLPYISKRTGAPVLTITAPVFDARKRLLAIVACSYDLLGANALETIHKQQFGRSGYLYVFDHERRIILHPDADRLLKQDIPPGANLLLDAALDGFEGVGETVNSRGIDMLVGYRPVPGMSWIVGAQIPKTEVFETLQNAVRFFVWAATLSLAVVLIVGFVMIRRITRPLNNLCQAAELITGELQGTVSGPDVIPLLESAHARDEIGALAAAFHRLVEHQRESVGMLKQAAAEWELTFDSVKEAVFVLDAEGTVFHINRMAADWFRVSAPAAVGRSAWEIIFGDNPPSFDLPAPLQLDTERAKVWTGVLPQREGVYEFAVSPLQQTGGATGMILIIRDFTDHARREDDIRKLATFDALTGLPNRTLLTDRLHLALAGSIRAQCGVAVLFLDLDRFKHVNDMYGHEVGDELLKAVAHRLVTMLRREDTLARFGGDEFVVVLSEISHPGDAGSIAAKIVRSILEPFFIEGHELNIGTSIGIAVSPQDGVDEQTLIKHADTAMYQAKKEGRSTFRFYEAV